MSVRLEMLQVARLAPRLLGESAPLVTEFLNQQLTAEGGFRNRAGDSDLYYTVFGLQALIALSADVPADRVAPFLRRFGDADGLDLVHTACLARCWAMVPGQLEAPDRSVLAARLERFRAADGGFHATPGSARGTAYHAFLAFGALQDLKQPAADEGALASSLNNLRASDGGYANDAGMAHGSTPATAAAIALLRQLGAAPDAALSRWLLGQFREGGFLAAPNAPLPDLLSTATALHALTTLHAPLDGIREACLDFIDSLWTSAGAFYGSWADDVVDCEYTFYGLLALGHLAV